MGQVDEAPSPSPSQRKADDPPLFYNDSKLEAGVPTVSEGDTFRDAADEVAAIPKGTIDPVYEAKARVLNHAVIKPEASPKHPVIIGQLVAQILIAPRSKKSGWGGISGSCSSSWGLAGQTTICGPL